MTHIQGKVGGANQEYLLQTERELEELSGFSYQLATEHLAALGNTPGCHAPLLLFFWHFLSRQPNIPILELGSGLSTAFLLLAAARLGHKLLAIEDVPKWYTLNQALFHRLQLSSKPSNFAYIGAGDSPGALYVREGSPSAGGSPFPNFYSALAGLGIADFGLMFVDCNGLRIETAEVFRHYIRQDGVIVFDDLEQDLKYRQVQAWASSAGLPPPRRFLSWTRGIGAIDLGGQIDFVDWLD